MAGVKHVVYPLSIGPACWMTSRTKVGVTAIPIVYRPITWLMSKSESVYEVLDWYSGLLAAGGWEWIEQWVGEDDEGTELYEPVWADVAKAGMM